MRKWRIIAELCERLANRTFEPGEFGNDLRCVCYAPNVGYRSWIFRYKGVYVALFDAGNDHYDFHTLVTLWDVVIAKAMGKLSGLRAWWEDEL